MDAFDIEIVERIYSASLVPELWPNVIDRMANRMQARGGSLFVLSDGHLSWDAPPSTKSIMERYIAEGWDKKNPRLNGLLKRAHPGFIQDSDVAEGDFSELPIVRDFLRPNGIAFTAATVVNGARDDLAVFSVDRDMPAGAFLPDEITWLDSLRPHLGRSIALTSRLRMQQAQTAMATLQMIGVPAAIISGNRTVTVTNALFDTLAGSVFMASAFGRLKLRDARADRVLQSILSARMDMPTIRSIPVTSMGTVIGVLHAIPACRQANDILGAGGTLLVLAQPKETASVDREWLRWLYDLSPAEANVASKLTRGLTIEDIACEVGNSQATIRTQVKAVLSKSGFKRQADFVRVVSSLNAIDPRLLASPPATAFDSRYGATGQHADKR